MDMMSIIENEREMNSPFVLVGVLILQVWFTKEQFGTHESLFILALIRGKVQEGSEKTQDYALLVIRII